jgi:hypothetical protein
MARKYKRWPTSKADQKLANRMKEQARGTPLTELAATVYKELSTLGEWSVCTLWGFRICKFWNGEFGINVEVGEPDEEREHELYNYSGILVLNVRTLADLPGTLFIIKNAEPWLYRRALMGLLTAAEKRKLKNIELPHL